MDDLMWVRASGLIMILGLSLPGIIFGYLITVRHKHRLLSGLEDSKVSNFEAHAKWRGYILLIGGVFSGIIGVGWCFGFFIDEISMSTSLVVVILIPIHYLFYRQLK
jgi:hypothetical protein